MTTTVAPVVLARLAATAAREVPGVLELDAGLAGEVATHGDGDRVPGVRVRAGGRRLEVRLVVAYGRPLPAIVDDVRAGVLAAVGTTGAVIDAVDVRVEGLRTVELRLPDPAAESEPRADRSAPPATGEQGEQEEAP